MQPFQFIKSLVIPLDMDNVDTDMIIPAQYLTKIDRNGYGENLFQRLREQDTQFVFNDPKYQSAKILLSKANFGCGSSREHAVWALKQAGIEVIIAESFSDIFANNAAKNGLLLITLSSETIEGLFHQMQTENLVIDVDLLNQKLILSNQEFNFDYDPFRKECLLKGQDDLDYLLEATQ